jgi:hypothetical protein
MSLRLRSEIDLKTTTAKKLKAQLNDITGVILEDEEKVLDILKM